MFVGGHSASFTAADILKHADGAIDCVLKGECEAKVVELLDAVARRGELLPIPGVGMLDGEGPPLGFDVKVLYVHHPAGRKGRKIDDATETFVDETRMGAD